MERPPVPVSVTQSLSREVPVYLEEIGRCVAREVVNRQAQVSGPIMGIHFRDGEDLKAGQLLFTIDPRPYQAQLDQANANLAQYQAALKLAKSELVRYENLIKTNYVSRQDYEIKVNAVEVAETQIKASLAAIATAKLNIEYCSIRSPIEGRASHRLVDVGNQITVGQSQTLLVIQRLDPIYVDFTVSENELTRVQESMKAGTLKVEVYFPESPATIRTGDLTFIDNEVSGATATIKLRATISNSDHYLWPGRFVKARLILSTLKQAVLVPAPALVDSAKGPLVYVVKKDSTAELRPVTTGQRQGDLLVILKGVKAGERVVTVGQMTITPGGKVRIEETPDLPVPQASGPATDNKKRKS